MFGNNTLGPFISPNMTYGPIMNNVPMMGMRTPSMLGTQPLLTQTRNGGILSSLFGRSGANILLPGARPFNFGTLLNNTSKALGVVKDAIPIVKEVGPMMGNMRSILKLASVFKDETDITTTTRDSKVEAPINNNTNENDTRTPSIINTNNNEPNFFL